MLENTRDLMMKTDEVMNELIKSLIDIETFSGMNEKDINMVTKTFELYGLAKKSMLEQVEMLEGIDEKTKAVLMKLEEQNRELRRIQQLKIEVD